MCKVGLLTLLNGPHAKLSKVGLWALEKKRVEWRQEKFSKSVGLKLRLGKVLILQVQAQYRKLSLVIVQFRFGLPAPGLVKFFLRILW